MRPLEWTVLFSFIPVLLLPAFPRAKRPLRTTAFVLPILIMLAHLWIEGWRIQMLALYILTGLLLAGTLLTQRQSASPGRRGILLRTLLLTTLAGTAVLTGFLLPVVTFPSPTGPYNVGVVDRELTDTMRDRKLMVSVWYPAEQSGMHAPLLSHPDEVIAGMADSFGFPALALQHLRYVTVSAGINAPLLQTTDTPFPVLIFSHGLVGLRMQNSTTFQELASWGYVVIALDHTDAAAATVLADGEVRYFDLERFGIYEDDTEYATAIEERLFPVWVSDQQFVLDTLESWNSDDPLFAGMLDLTRIGSFGHSFGGATAFELCRVDARCAAAVNLDGGVRGGVTTQPSVRPLLLMTSEDSREIAYAVENWQWVIDHAEGDALWLELPASSHLSFTITQLLSPVLVPSGFDPRAGLRIVDNYVRTFFDVKLRDADPALLQPQPDAARAMSSTAQAGLLQF